MNKYREPGLEIDSTEIERARIHEEGETARAGVEARKEFWRRHGIVIILSATMLASTTLIGGVLLAEAWLDQRSPPQAVKCTDRITNEKCVHPDHTLTKAGDHFVCLCPRATPAIATPASSTP